LRGLIAIGHITKSVGLRGELKVVPLTADPERFHDLTSLWLGRDESSARECRLAACRVTPKGAFLRIVSIDNKEAAEEVRGWYVFVPEEQALKLPRGTHFIHEIVGLAVETETGERIGTVTDVQNYPAQDIWIVGTGSKEIMIPAVKEIVRQVDLKEKRIIIRAIEGLLDAN